MRVIDSGKRLQQFALEYRQLGKSIGFVPTMGYLHAGHEALLEAARQENDLLILSVFVNPIQFGPHEDFAAYPRNRAHDEEVAKKHQVDLMFCPSVEEMYPKPLSVQVQVLQRTDRLCGASRPGHFDGVATVLTKLFALTMPDRVYFGMKDAQQVAVVSALIEDFHFPIQLVPIDTVREEDGLAKSSRNVNLTAQERREAPILYKSLQYAKAQLEKEDVQQPAPLIAGIKAMIEANSSGIIDYVEVLSYPELQPVSIVKGKIIIALAVKFSKARLIDNMVLEV